MNKANKNNHSDLIPLRVLINKQSEKGLKDTFKDDIPPTLKYTLDDFRDLHKIFLGVNDFKDLSLLRVKMHITDCFGFEFNSETEVFFHFHKNRKDPTLGEVYKFLFKLPLKEVPLYINHPYLNLIAKWRLQTNK